MKPGRVVLTGGPGAGKTTVLERLQELGFAVVPEVARQVIAERKSKRLNPRPPPVDFARAILKRDIEQYRAAADGLTFFDRSVLDALGMLSACGQLTSGERKELLAQYPYRSPVFLFPPWATIYRTDSERDQTFGEAVQVHSLVRDWYTECGYGISSVPLGTVDERCEHILRELGEWR